MLGVPVLVREIFESGGRGEVALRPKYDCFLLAALP